MLAAPAEIEATGTAARREAWRLMPRWLAKAVDDTPFVVKLLAPLVLSFVALMVTAGALWHQVELNLAILTEMSDQTVVGNAKLFDIVDRFDNLNGQLYQHLSQMLSNQEPADPATIDALVTELRSTETELKAYERDYADPDTAREVAKAIEDLNVYRNELTFVRQMLEVDVGSAASFIQPFDLSYRSLRERLSVLLNDAVADTQRTVQHRRHDANRSGQILLFVDAATTLVLFGIGLVVIFSSRRSIDSISAATLNIAGGELSENLALLERRDELGAIVATLEIFQANRRELDQYRHELEAVVKERTTKLEETNTELNNAIETLRDAQEELVEQGKLASLGSIVAGVAHEVNTPIGVCVTCASLLQDRLRELTIAYEGGTLKKRDIHQFVVDNQEVASLLQVNLHRASELVRSFKQIAADQTYDEARQLDLGAYINDIATSLRVEMKRYGHKLEIECPEPILITLHPSAIWQIMSNLIMNSLIHAYDEGVRGSLRIQLVQTQNHARISYSDDGNGMPDEVRRRIFEPFFTTKRGSGGTGLGMSIAYNLTKTVLHGTITCDSVPGGGTSFVLKIPHARSQPDPSTI